MHAWNGVSHCLFYDGCFLIGNSECLDFFSMRKRPINNNKGYSAAVVCCVHLTELCV